MKYLTQQIFTFDASDVSERLAWHGLKTEDEAQSKTMTTGTLWVGVYVVSSAIAASLVDTPGIAVFSTAALTFCHKTGRLLLENVP